MLYLQKTNNQDPHFLYLVKELDANLKETDGDDHSFYNQFNSIADIKHILVGYLNNEPVCCGAFKTVSPKIAEVKRMYTRPKARGKGLAKQVLVTLEGWAASLGYKQLILETGINQQAALKLYANCGYKKIPNYGPYVGVSGSHCFAKTLK